MRFIGTLTLFSCGVLLGAACFSVLNRALPDQFAPAERTALVAQTDTATVASLDRRAGVERQDWLLLSDRMTAYESALSFTDASTLESHIAALINSDPTPARSAELDLLLTRLVELDPDRILSLAWDPGLPPEILAAALRSWAEFDLESALAMMRDLPDQRSLYEVATALLDVVGYSNESIELLGSVRADLDVNGLRIAMLERLAERDMPAALREISTISDGATRRAAVEAIAVGAGSNHPADALANAQMLSWDDQVFFGRPFAERWAEIDPHGFLAHLEELDGDPWNVTRVELGLRAAAFRDPERTLAATSQLPSTWRTAAQYVVVEVLAEQDPDAAMDFVQAMPPGEARNRLWHAAASGFALADPEAALAWAMSLDDPPADITDAILTALAATDLERAVDITLEGNLPARFGGRAPVWLASGFHSTLDDPGALADRIVASRGRQSGNLLQATLSRWAASDPVAALSWLGSRNLIDRQTMQPLAQAMGRYDLAGTIGQAAVLPEHLRSEWIETAVSSYASGDPVGVADAIAAFQGQPIHDTLLGVASRRIAIRDPRLAAELVTDASPSTQMSVAPSVGSMWVRREPVAAAQWAAGLRDASVSARTVGVAVSAWATFDPDGAYQWAIALPEGEVRSRALASLGPSPGAGRGGVP